MYITDIFKHLNGGFYSTWMMSAEKFCAAWEIRWYGSIKNSEW